MGAQLEGCVLDSDEDERPLRAGDTHAAAIGDDEVLSSDGEQPWQPPTQWATEPAAVLRQLNALLLPGTQQQQSKAFARSNPSKLALSRASSTMTGRSSKGPGFWRPMKTVAAADADRAAAERAVAEVAELSASLATTESHPVNGAGGGLWDQQQQAAGPEQQQQQRPSAAGIRRVAAMSFLNWKSLPRAPSHTEELRPKLEGSQLAVVAAAAGSGSGAAAEEDAEPASAAAAKSHVSPPHAQQQQPGKQQQHWSSRPSVANAASGDQVAAPAPALPCLGRPANAAAASAATFHRTADGLNVVYLSRQATAAGSQGAGSSKAKSRAESVNSGWGNNFVRIDLKKGHGSTKYGTKHGSKRHKRAGGRGGSRWQTPRMRQVGDGSDFLEGWQGSRLRCFKCGTSGHFAKECTVAQQAQADVGALCSGSSDEDGKGMASGSVQAACPGAPAASGQQQPGAASVAVPAARLTSSIQGMPSNGSKMPPPPDPADQYAAVLADASEEALSGVLRNVFGHAAFRGLQLPTVQRLLGGESLLSIMPTGMGKSLCYQLPAALLPGLTLVVSPLIALMHDQAASVPPPLTAAVLWSGQRRADAVQVLGDVAAGRVKMLFVSPERLNNPHLLEALRTCMPLPLVVVDEAHCVAEWGHSFRPAYFRLGAALASHVCAKRILALTATATWTTETAIIQVLRIPAESVLRDAAVRQNLRLHVLRTGGGGSSQATRDRICGLFNGSGPLAAVRCAIVYCAFKDDANQLARLLSTRGVSSRAYHAGKDYRERSAIEADFAAGRVRVVAATVAFGMGINLMGVGGVVHAMLPRSLEEYVQQVGRAGRDGSEARCVALLDDSDFVRLRSLAFSGVLDLAAVRAFLGAVFSPTAQGHRPTRKGAKPAVVVPVVAVVGGRAGGRSRKRKAAAQVAVDASIEEEGEEAAASVAATKDAKLTPSSSSDVAQEGGQEQSRPGSEEVEEPVAWRRFGVLAVQKLGAELDMREESMESMLSYLEADAHPCLRMLPATALSVKVSFYAVAPEQLAPQYPVVQSVLESCPNPRNGVYSVHAAKLAAAAQKAPSLVLQELREMASGSLIGFELSREEGPAYEILHTPHDLDGLAQKVHARLAAVLACQVARLDVSYRALLAAVQAGQAVAGAAEEQAAAQEAALRAALDRYFEEQGAAGPGGNASVGTAATAAAGSEASTASALLLDTEGLPLKRAELALLQAGRAVIRRNRQQAGPTLSARALARILHGVGSPAFPADAWNKRMGAFWGSQSHVDFAAVLKAAEMVLRDD